MTQDRELQKIAGLIRRMNDVESFSLSNRHLTNDQVKRIKQYFGSRLDLRAIVIPFPIFAVASGRYIIKS